MLFPFNQKFNVGQTNGIVANVNEKFACFVTYQQNILKQGYLVADTLK